MSDALSIGLSSVCKSLRNLDVSTNASGSPWSSPTITRPLRLSVFSSSTGVSHALLKAVIEIPYPVALCVNEVLVDPAVRLKWDRNLSGIKSVPVDAPVAWLPADADEAAGLPVPRAIIQYSLTNAVGPISARDFVDSVIEAPISALPGDAAVAAAAARLPPGTFISAAGGVPLGSAIDQSWPQPSGIVRGANDACGWIFEPLSVEAANVAEFGPLIAPQGATRITYLIQTNIRGWLPTLVVNTSIYGLYKDFTTDLLAHLAEVTARKG